MRVVGSGFGRTGTFSLKTALEKLLGKPCYHMATVFEHLETDVPVWTAATRGEAVDWPKFFAEYGAAVDLPASIFWREIAAVFPEAIIVHSTRDTESWWQSASQTIFNNPFSEMPPHMKDWGNMVQELVSTRFTPDYKNEVAAKGAFEKHNREVLAEADPARLLVWHPRDGWEPLCKALNLPVPDEPFPQLNTREEFIARASKRGDADAH